MNRTVPVEKRDPESVWNKIGLMSGLLRINLDEPRWDQNTYTGRLKHFLSTTNPLNLFCSSSELEDAKKIVTKYRKGDDILGLTEDKLWRAKQIYDSAFHPDSGEKMLLIGRMSAQVPMNMTITGCMLLFFVFIIYLSLRSRPEVIFWQWINQSFNAVVNYTNRSGDSPISVPQLGLSYAMATSGALVTALGLNSLVKHASPLAGRFVPFCAVAAANCVNIPMMRQKELKDGIAVVDEHGEKLGNSKVAAKKAIIQVVFSRIGMAIPGMVIPPLIMNSLENKGYLKRFPLMGAPLQVIMCGICLTFATPMCCALFPQKSSIETSKLEPEIQEKIKQSGRSINRLYFNKGL
ncbi:Sideroflexin-1 [Nymphon striatum]|nr:Sideroflexin-1 [Nymphon striatum]